MDGGVGLALICFSAIFLFGVSTMLLIHDFAEAWFPALLAALFGIGFLPLMIRTRRTHRRLRWLFTGRCPECGYDLTANTTGTCPECGEPIEKPCDTVSK